MVGFVGDEVRMDRVSLFRICMYVCMHSVGVSAGATNVRPYLALFR